MRTAFYSFKITLALCLAAAITGCGEDEVVIAPVNEQPVADAGVDQTVETGVLVVLDGSNSYDPEDDPLTYRWEANSENPAIVELSEPDGPGPSFPVTTAGVYKFTLTVNDGNMDSEADEVVINVTGDDIIGFTQGEKWHVSVLSIEKKYELGGIFEYWTTRSGYVFLILELRFQELSREGNLQEATLELKLDSQWLTLSDSEGRTYNVSASGNGIWNAGFGSVTIFLYGDNSTVTVKWGFVVPEDATGFTVTFLDYPPIDLGI